jgi:cobalt-zinc-cadmium efflux system membrane fusion protein
VTAPLLTVVGSVMARLNPGKDSPEARWDFPAPELASSYADWLKAAADEKFAEKQVVTIVALAKARFNQAEDVVLRARKEEKIGAVSKKDLMAAETDLLLARLQGQKDEFEAQTAVKNATRTRVALERQLYQAGVDPLLLEKKTGAEASHYPFVVAEVPETKVSLVKVGDGCQAQFYAFPKHKPFTGKVASIAPTLNRERRTLKVFFELHDSEYLLRPGMFADVGLGTDPRPALLVPADGVVHVGQADYVMV